MSEQALLNRFQKSDETDVDQWLMADSKLAKPQQPAAQPPQPEPTPAEDRGAPGFFNSLDRAAGAVKTRFSEGLQQVGEAYKGVRKTESDDKTFQPVELGDITIPREAVRIATGLMGALNTAFPFSAGAGSLYGDFTEWLSKGDLTDEAVKARLEKVNADIASGHSPTPGSDPGEKAYLERMLLMPYEERLKQANEAGRTTGEVMSALVPGYTGAARLLGKGMGIGKAGADAARVARIEAVAQAGERAVAGMKQPLVLPEHAGPTRLGGAIPQPRSPMDLTPAQRFHVLRTDPEARQAIEDIFREYEAGPRATPSERPNVVTEPGKARVEGQTAREQLREQGRTPLEAQKAPEPTAAPAKALTTEQAAELVRSTNEGGASFDVAEGRLRRLPEEGGFYVGIAPDRTVTISGREVTEADFVRFAEKNADLLGKPGAHIGTEKLPDGTVNIDVSVRKDTQDEAMRLAQEHGQERIFDGNTFESIDVPKAPAPELGPVAVKAYHGTGADFEKYSTSNIYGGTFFAENPETASRYAMRAAADIGAAEVTPNVRPVALRLQKPAPEALYRDALDLMQGDPALAAEALKSKGYDGVVFKGEDTGKGPHYLSFDPNAAAAPFYGEVGKPLETAVEAAKRRIAERFGEITGDLTNEAGAVQLRGSFTEGWEKNRQFMNDLATVGSAYLWEGARSFKAWSERMVQEFGEQIVPQLKTLFEAAQERVRSLVTPAGTSKGLASSKEMLKKFHEGAFAADWYDAAKDEFTRMFGANADLMADLVAATSPNMDVKSNISLAIKAMEQIMSGDRHAGKLFTGDDGFIGAHLRNLNRILRDEPLSGPKVAEFARAIKGDRDAVVVDTWMRRAFGYPETKSHNRTAAEIGFIQRTVSDMARELGLDNRQVQAAIWSAEKIRQEGQQEIKPLAEAVKDALNEKGLLNRDWVFPKSFEETLPSWVTEEGKISMGTLFVLGRAALGATVGAMTGDDPETTVRNTLLAAGVSSLLSPKLAKAVVKAMADPETRDILKMAVQDETGAVKLNFPKRAVGENPSPNTARMGTTPEAKALVRGINEKLQAAGELARGTTQTHADTIQQALQSPYKTVEAVLGLDTAKLSLDELAAAKTAARGVRDAVLEDVIQTAARAKLTGDAALAKETKDKFLLGGKISQQVTDLETHVARASEAGKIQSNAAVASKYDMNTLSKDLSEMDAALLRDGKISDQQLVEMISSMGDRAAAAKLASVASKWPQALWNIYYGLNLLGSPLTQFRNVIGNMGGLTMAVADRAMGEIIAAPFHAIGKGGNMVQFGETYELAKGLYQIVADSFRGGKDVKGAFGYARDAYKSGESLFGLGKESEALRAIRMAREEGNGSFPTVIQAMSSLAEANMRVMGGTDEFFKVLSFHSELRALALREAKGAGKLEGKALAQEIERLVDEPTKEMLAGATEFAKENTFTKAFTPGAQDWRHLWGVGAQTETLARNPLMRVLVTPFYRTPMRIAEFGTVHTPGLNLLAVQFSSDMAAGGTKGNLAWAKLATGGGMMGLVGWYAAHGYITGNWPADPQLRSKYEMAGWQPKSIYNPTNGKYYSYDNLEPVSSLIGTMADFIQISRDLPEYDAQTLFMAGALAAGKNAIAKQWFSGVSDLTDVIEAATRNEDVGKGLEFVHRRMASLIPGAAIGRLINNMTDAQKRDMKSVQDHENPELREFEKLVNIYKATVPGWGRSRPAIPNMITGEPLPNENTWLGAINPFQQTTFKNDKVLNELVALDGAGLPKELPRVVGGPQPPGPFKLPGDEQKQIREGVLLSDPERVRLGQLLTKEITDHNGNTLHEALADLMDTEEYKDASDGRYGGKATLMALTFNSFLRQAEDALFEEYPKLEQVIQRRKLERALGKMPNSMEDLKEPMRESLQGVGR